jgi:hypothetical protein
MTVSVIERTAASTNPDGHTDWCDPTECEIGVQDPDDDGTDISTIHVKTLARFSAAHGEISDRLVPVRLAREQSSGEDVLRLYVGSAVVLVTDDLLGRLDSLAAVARRVTS